MWLFKLHYISENYDIIDVFVCVNPGYPDECKAAENSVYQV